jgi:TolB-like protein/Tfp pilus assembly protein PilF
MSGGTVNAERAQALARGTADLGGTHTTSSAEYIVGEVKKHKRSALVAVLALALAVAAASYFYFARSGRAAIDSIAVLPFVNMPADPNTEWLSDGLTESIINNLSQVSNLHVTARSTVFRYKGQDADPQRVGRELGVRALLTGRVAQRGDDLSVQAELVDASTGAQLWGEQYNRKLSDVMDVQHDISREIANKLRLRLSGEQMGRMMRHYTENAEAYQLYLKGRFYWNKRTGETLQKSIEYFNQAIERDPTYALAFAGLADAYTLQCLYGNRSARECFPQAEAAAQKALEIDDTLAEAHTALAYPTFIYGWDFVNSETAFRRAIELNPNYATAHQWYGECLVHLGRFDEGIAEMKRAQELDPLSMIINSVIGRAYARARQYDQAIEQLQKVVAMDQEFVPARDFLRWAYEDKGMFEEAATAYENWAVLSGDVSREAAAQRASELRQAYRRSGAKGYWQVRLNLSMEDMKRHYVDPYDIARFYARLGEKDQSLAWLQKGYDERVDGMTLLKVEPDFDDLRSDPRFQDLVHRVGLPQ